MWKWIPIDVPVVKKTKTELEKIGAAPFYGISKPNGCSHDRSCCRYGIRSGELHNPIQAKSGLSREMK